MAQPSIPFVLKFNSMDSMSAITLLFSPLILSILLLSSFHPLAMLLGTVLLLKQILVFFSSPPYSVVYQKCQILSSNSTFIYNDMEAGHEDLFATCDNFIEEGVVYDYEYLSFLILLFTDTPLPVHSFLL